jgi:hypothetical protein
MKIIFALLMTIPLSQAFAAQEIKVSDVVTPLVETFNEAAVLAPEIDGVELAAPDVLTDPSSADEVRSATLQFDSQALNADGNIRAGIENSHSILNTAREKSSGNWRSIFTNVQGRLNGTTVTWPNRGQDFKACRANTLAFVIRGINKIHLCAGLAHGGQSANYLAQTLIHEGAHLAQFWNECEATKVEVNAMRVSGVGLAFRNGYMAKCGIN